MSLIDTKNFKDVIEFGKSLKNYLLLLEEKRSSFNIRNEVTENGIEKNLKIKDLTGAGDLFAAGFLHAYINTPVQQNV